MNRILELWRRLLYLGRRGAIDAALTDEIRFHIESRADELEQSGLSRADALAQAAREFGPRARHGEDSRATWQFQWIEDVGSDLRYAWRALKRSPGFAAAAILSLALGIGANTTIFSLTMEFLFSVPSAREPQRLVSIQLANSSHEPMRVYRFLRDAHVFSGLTGSFEESEVNWQNAAGSRRLSVYRVTSDFFQVVDPPMAMGRGMQPGERGVAVVDYDFWKRDLGADPDVLGRVLILDGEPHTVTGVLARDHRTVLGFGFAPVMYLPVTREDAIVSLTARLPQGMSLDSAYARLKAACQELDRVFPQRDFKRADDIQLSPLAGMDRLRMMNAIPLTAFFAMLMIVVGLVLAIACTNVASLLLARGSSRRQELGIRLAIGAKRGRLIRQLLAESLLLAILGTLAGLAINLWLTGVFNRVDLPLPIRLQLRISPDWRLLLYACAIAIGSALLCGLLPALKATRTDLQSSLRLRESSGADGLWNLRNVLVAGQLAISILLLSAGFLFLRNLLAATAMNPGFDLDHTLWAAMRTVPEKYTDPRAAERLVENALTSLRQTPGVEAAAVARIVPLNSQQTNRTDIRTDRGKNVNVKFKENSVGPDYFRTMDIPIVAGREFLGSDRSGTPAVVIVNENLARELFGETNPVGHIIRFVRENEAMTIVGVARNSRYFTLGEQNAMALYFAFAQRRPPDALHFLVRTESPASMVRPVTTILEKLDYTAAIETKPMRNAMFLALLPSRAGAGLLGAVGLLGLMLASIGLYGVLAYAVGRRRREIGLRMALGATPRDVLGTVFRDAFILTGAGIAIGIGMALILVKPLAVFLVPAISTHDPIAFGSVVIVLALVAAAATLGPALRASRVDPMVALRYE